jgi:ubiquinone/menaquinone biosynthesis C-methylase UbiE
LPFKDSVFDLAMTYFTMHEINPDLHLNVVSELARVSKKITLVEPNQGQDSIYRRYNDLWTRAMHELSKFEDLKELTYWKTLLEKCNFKLLTQEKITYQNQIPASEVDDFINNSTTAMKEYGVSRKYINEMKALAKDIKQKGMRLSDITVLIGEKS